MSNDIVTQDARPLQVAEQPGTPAYLIQLAIQQNADLDKLERLMAMQERWKEQQAKEAYNVAFAAFRAEGVKVIRSKGRASGPLQGQKYADLHSFVSAVTPALSKHGLSASWNITKDAPDWIEVTFTLRHALGHFEAVAMGGPPDAGSARNALQARSSTVSYLERYTLKAITGLSEQDDDDDGGKPKTGDANTAEHAALVDAGYAKASGGMKSLTDWWGTLNAKQRGSLNNEFRAMRKEAEGAGNA